MKHPTLLSDLEKHLEGFHFAEPSSIKQQDQVPGRAMISGIEVHGGFSCFAELLDRKECPWAYLELDLLCEHTKKKHGRSYPRWMLLNHHCDCQMVFRGNLKRWFRVNTGQ
jgi:hypothetical protein